MIFGYARISTSSQNLDLQVDALLKAGVDIKNIYIDKVSGIKSQRKNLSKLMEHLREGDTLVVWKLDKITFLLTKSLKF